MSDVVAPGVLKSPKPRRALKVTDFVVLAVILIVILVLAVTLIRKLQLKNEVSAARNVSDALVVDLAKADANSARKLGDKSFQAKNSVTHLSAVFASVNELAKGSPSVIRQTVDKSTKPDTVYIIYKYSGNTPYYIRIGAGKESGTWYLKNVSGSATESSLIVNK